ncbi:hypothetical protein SAMN04489859_102058 [Paracoccus alcaliphilus]|uniref:Uncharacterized protein n=1 Tax=Paracoccus alcaliphilus TaxID=34002 RepID=A0A1H8K4P0_9RHOB|nr:hypothetical protein [Paracoccus alcaliphilus]WCR17553.1 hypothetical protein JHW40_14630 [Paracoccus alcaliphilus]SEN87942.1 hypothetical protein SAMN04489859_102058 [Paracoccus alcaliphilus]
MTHTDLIARLRLKGPQAHEQPNHHIRRMEVERIEAADALTRNKTLEDVLSEILQHEECSFFGPDAEKHKRAQWRGIRRKIKAALATVGKGGG